MLNALAKKKNTNDIRIFVIFISIQLASLIFYCSTLTTAGQKRMNTFTNSSILSNLPATSHAKRQGSAVAYGSGRLGEVPALSALTAENAVWKFGSAR